MRNRGITFLFSLAISFHSGLIAGSFSEDVLPILQRSCLKCHGGEKTKGHVDFSEITSERKAEAHLDLWQAVIEVIEFGEMPPEEEKSLTIAEKKSIADWHREFSKLPSKPQVPLHRPRRLSANEYRNTLESLFGFEMEVGIAQAEQTVSGEQSLVLKILPQDPPGPSGFFNDTSSVVLSSPMLENYAYLGGVALDRLFSVNGMKPLTQMLGEEIAKVGAISSKHAESLFRNFIASAFRREPDEERIQKALDSLDGKKGENLLKALKFEMKNILISPEFLYRGLLLKPRKKSSREQVDDFELAERLSYFLWEDMPDKELFDLAKQGKLNDHKQLELQVARMLSNPKARNLADSFGVQLLDLASIDEQFRNDPIRLHALRSQPRDFLHYLFTEDRPVMELLDSNVTFANASTSGFYGRDRLKMKKYVKPRGIERQRTMNQRLTIKEAEGRGGILTMPSILAMNRGPILRGTWILRKILGVRLGEPPADVPPVKPSPRGQRLTFRQRFEVHRENQSCARCHEKIDPLGFALDGYDANGRYLLASYNNRGNQPSVDTSGKLPSGEEFRDFPELKKILLTEKKDQIVRNLVSQVLSYALCRKLERGDQPIVDEISKRIVRQNGSWKDLFIEVANSLPFRETAFTTDRDEQSLEN